MSEKSGRIAVYLSHIAQAIERIEAYLEGTTREGFIGNTLIQDAVIRNLEIVGEASRSILRNDPGFVSRHPELPLQSAYEMRNVLAHGYFEVDLEIVWGTVQRDLPELQRNVREAIARLSPDGGC
jgi:uncharacterized protein with HEPN domain